MNYKLIGSATTGLVLGGTVTYLSFALGEDFNASALNLLIVVLGLALGWLLGILLSPYSGAEEKKFSEYAKAFGVFASGYLVAKVDKVIEALFQPDFILDSIHGFRVMAFVAALIIGLVVTFIFRRYG
jgi:hypothetical protein